MKNSKKFKVILSNFVLFLALMFVISGSVDVKAAAPKLNKKKITIYVGHTKKLKVNNVRGKVKWASSQKKVAEVSSKGIVKGKKAGSTTITATVGNKRMICNVTVKNNVSVSKKTMKLSPGESRKIKIKIQKHVNSIRFKVKDPNVISCKWGNWKGMTIPLTITAKQSGSTYVTITNTYSKEKVRVNVTVPSEWENVEVVIPETIGEQGEESNRMKITNYSFYQTAGWTGSYYMHVEFKMVKYGNTGRDSWGEYVFSYDKNGNILDKSFLYVYGLKLGKSFNGELRVPEGTAKIVFMEYPDTSDTSDDTKWHYSDLQAIDDYAGKAADHAKEAWNCACEAQNSPMLSVAYAPMALSELKIAKENMQYVYDYVIKKEDVGLVDADGNPKGTLQEKTYEVLSMFDGVEDLTKTDVDAIYKMSSNAMRKTSIYRVLIAKLLS